MVKGYNGFNYEMIEPDESIRKFRRDLGFDYGKFDYVVHEGETVLLDINPTPTYADGIDTPEVRHELSSVLAKGITQWLPSPLPISQ